MFAGDLQRLNGRHNANLLAADAVDHAHLGHANAFVDSGLVLESSAAVIGRAAIVAVEGCANSAV
jgi:hypothetical protein